MDSIEKLDLFQSLKDEESNDHEGTSLKSISESDADHRDPEDLKFEDSNRRSISDEDLDQAGPSEKKLKLDKLNRKEIEEEEREKML
jgi:hypothetical protein